MKIQYLGTAAAEGIPAIFCDCEKCKKSRLLGGRNIRTRSQALVDDRLLIDFPADTYMHFLRYNIPLTKIKNCLITHSHSDHLYPKDLGMRKKIIYSHFEEEFPLNVYSDKSAYEIMCDIKEDYNLDDNELLVHQINPYEPFEFDGYNVVALRAEHSPITTPVIYLIERDGKSILYAHDTSELPKESMEYLKTLKKPIDLISLDCTFGNSEFPGSGHLTLNRCIDVRKALIEIGAADNKTVFVLNHFTHNGINVVYDEFVEIAAEHSFEVSYDGMTVEI